MRWNNKLQLLTAFACRGIWGNSWCWQCDFPSVFLPLVSAQYHCACLHLNSYSEWALWLGCSTLNAFYPGLIDLNSCDTARCIWPAFLEAIKSVQRMSALTFPRPIRLAPLCLQWPLRWNTAPLPQSHLVPNWAILLLFSPSGLWLSLPQSDAWKATINDGGCSRGECNVCLRNFVAIVCLRSVGDFFFHLSFTRQRDIQLLKE